MERLVLDNGLKSFEIADNDGNVRGVITFNPSDFGFVDRSKKLMNEINEYVDTLPDDMNEDMLIEIDKIVKEKINVLFGSDVSTVIFGNTNCLSFSDGKPLFHKALEALIPVVTKAIKSEMKAGADSIEKYTEGIK